MSFKGFDDLDKLLEEIEQKVTDILNGEWKFNEIFTQDVMSKFTKFNTIEEFLENSPAEHGTQEEFDNRDTIKFDEFVNDNTEFATWDDFFAVARNELAKRELGKYGFKLG